MAVSVQASQQHFLGDARSRSVWRWQLMLSISVIAISGVSAVLTPEVFRDWRFLSALSYIVIITLIALGVRWEHASKSMILALAIADIYVIFLLNEGSSVSLAFLWIFPISWIATYYSTFTLVISLSAVGGFMLLGLAIHGFSVNEAISSVMLLIALGFIGTTIATGSQRTRSAKRLLSAQAQRVETTLHRVQEQKARSQRLLDSLEIGVARVGEGGQLQLANQRFRELYSFDESSQLSISRAVEYQSRRGMTTPLEQTTIMRASRGELFVNEPTWLFGTDGKWRVLNATTRVIEIGEHEDDGLLLIVEEVTDKVDPQATHGAAMRLISHELRNPLTAVLGHVDLLLEREDLPESARNQAAVIERAADRMQLLIDQALAVDGPSVEDDDVQFDLAETARTSVESFRPTAESKTIRLNVDLEESLVVHGDVFRIRQVIDNVLSNAIKYSDRGATVIVRGVSESDRQVSIEINDTGVGISQEDLPNIFNPDFRAPSAVASGVPGTGLGLSISRDIAYQCGGTLEAQSELGKGTTMKIALPVQGRRQHR